jgi:hypothetical protein
LANQLRVEPTELANQNPAFVKKLQAGADFFMVLQPSQKPLFWSFFTRQQFLEPMKPKDGRLFHIQPFQEKITKSDLCKYM